MVWKPSRPPERPPHLTGHSGSTVTYPSTLFVVFGGIATEDGNVTGKLWLYDPLQAHGRKERRILKGHQQLDGATLVWLRKGIH